VKVTVLLATYNSSRFLREQLDSLFAQTFQDWTMVVRDDGSSDDTLKIIEEYSKVHANIDVLPDQEKNVGAKESFMRLLKSTASDYYFFCDHDDVWLPSKMEESLRLLLATQRNHPGKPVIIHSDLRVVNDELQTVSESFWKSSKIYPKILENKNYIQVFNCVTGCTMLFNAEVKKIAIPYPQSIPMHDWWLALITLRNGGIIRHLNEPTILYRQHGENEVGARLVNGTYFTGKIRNIKATFRGQKEVLDFLKDIKALNWVQYYYFKIRYSIQRIFPK